jgi:hypothetical protein
MGNIPIWKLPDLTHKILLEKEIKVRKIVGAEGRRRMHEWVGGPFRKKRSARGSLVLKKN